MSDNVLAPVSSAQRPWDARLARWLVTPLAASRVTPNHLTTVRLAVGLAGAAAFTRGTYGWCNIAALLVIVSNFLDHTDGELARLSGKTSRVGHVYDLASDAAVTILLFVAMGVGVGMSTTMLLAIPPARAGRGRRRRGRADLLPAHARRGDGRQSRDPPALARRLRDGGCSRTCCRW